MDIYKARSQKFIITNWLTSREICKIKSSRIILVYSILKHLPGIRNTLSCLLHVIKEHSKTCFKNYKILGFFVTIAYYNKHVLYHVKLLQFGYSLLSGIYYFASWEYRYVSYIYILYLLLIVFQKVTRGRT